MNYTSFHSTKPLILIVEDDESIAEVISLLIAEETSYQPAIADSGEAALQVLHELPRVPQLFILDYRLPDTTGIQLYDYFQSQPQYKDTPTLLMSASKPVEEIEPRDIIMICKPFDLDDFLAKIYHLLKHDTVTV
ncbi:hypothetical protein ccbrp13_44100 [Ktedonobacteria bacterium brp13]|nr:hypothetical protein ccbrp13_44100 [Ktedonobacteria bacterium brp13]